MSKYIRPSWRKLGAGIALSFIGLVALACGAIAMASMPSGDDRSSPPAFDLAGQRQTLPDIPFPTLPPTPEPTPVPTAVPTPEPTPVPVTPPPPPPPPPRTPPPPPPLAHGYRYDLAQQVFALLNQKRAENGLAGVTANGILTATAEYYTKLHFTRANPYQLNHYLDGGPGDRAWARGYCCAVGEILVTSQGSAEGMVQLWMDSGTHRSVITDPQYREMGVSCYGGEYREADGLISYPVICAAEFGSGG